MNQHPQAPSPRRSDTPMFALGDMFDAGNTRQHPQYDSLIRACRSLPPIRTAVVHPCDENSISAAMAASVGKLIEPVLVGPETRIRALATTLGFDLANVQLVSTPPDHRRHPRWTVGAGQCDQS